MSIVERQISISKTQIISSLNPRCHLFYISENCLNIKKLINWIKREVLSAYHVVSLFKLCPHPSVRTDKRLPIVPTQWLINHFEAADSCWHVSNQPVTEICTEYPVSHVTSDLCFVWQIHFEGVETLAVICRRKCNKLGQNMIPLLAPASLD